MSDLIAVDPDTGLTRRATSEAHMQTLLSLGWEPHDPDPADDPSDGPTSAAAEVSDEPEPQQED